MDPKALAEIDRQIAQLKKELNSLFWKRIAILQDEIRRSEVEAQALNMSPALATSPAKLKRPRPPKQFPSAEEEPQPVSNEAAPEPAAKATPAPSPEPKVESEPEPDQPARRKSPPAETESPILDALREVGLFGMTQAEISKKTGMSAQSVAKKLKDLPGLTKKGTGREARYYLKS